MAYNLTIDQGNTRTKMALWQNGAMVRTFLFENSDAFQLSEIVSYEIDKAIVCSVCSTTESIVAELRPRVGEMIELSSDTSLPVLIDYVTPKTLGMDRLAAAVGAYSLEECKNRNILICDLGTALTFDLVSADGHYKGGNISAGMNMRLKALHSFTAKLPLIEIATDEYTFPTWGQTTDGALIAGAVRGVASEVMYYRNMAGEGAVVVLTGGDANLISSLLDFTPVIEPNLVHKGLHAIIEFNQ